MARKQQTLPASGAAVTYVKLGGRREAVPCFHPRPVYPVVHEEAVWRFEEIVRNGSDVGGCRSTQKVPPTALFLPPPASVWNDSKLALGHPGPYSPTFPDPLRDIWEDGHVPEVHGRPDSPLAVSGQVAELSSFPNNTAKQSHNFNKNTFPTGHPYMPPATLGAYSSPPGTLATTGRSVYGAQSPYIPAEPSLAFPAFNLVPPVPGAWGRSFDRLEPLDDHITCFDKDVTWWADTAPENTASHQEITASTLPCAQDIVPRPGAKKGYGGVTAADLLKDIHSGVFFRTRDYSYQVPQETRPSRLPAQSNTVLSSSWTREANCRGDFNGHFSVVNSVVNWILGDHMDSEPSEMFLGDV